MQIKEDYNLKDLEEYGFKEYKKFYKRTAIVRRRFFGDFLVETKIRKDNKRIINKIMWGVFRSKKDAIFGIEDLIERGIVEEYEQEQAN